MNVTNRIADEYRRINPKMDPPVNIMTYQSLEIKIDTLPPNRLEDFFPPTETCGWRVLLVENPLSKELIFFTFSVLGWQFSPQKKLSLWSQGPYCLTVGFHLPGFTVLGTQWLAQGCARPWCQGADLTGNILRWPFFWDPPVLQKGLQNKVVGVRYFTTWWSWCSCHCPTTKVTIVTVELETVAKKKVLFLTMKSSSQLKFFNILCMFIHMHWDFFASLNIRFFSCFASMSASFMKLSQGILYVVLKQYDGFQR